jgi:hypothetical protein
VWFIAIRKVMSAALLMTRIGGGSTLLLIFMAMFVPTAYLPLKAGLLLLACSVALLGMLFGFFKINKAAFFAILAVTSVGLLYSFHGLLNGAPGAVRVLTVYFLWPWVFLLLSVYLSHDRSLEVFFKVLIASLIFIIIYSFLFLGTKAGVVPGSLYFELDQGQRVGFYDGFIEYNLYSISSLLFLVPLAIHFYYIKLKLPRRKHTYFWLALILASIILTFLSGRRAMLLVFMLIPIIILAEWFLFSGLKKLPKKIRRLSKSPGSYVLAIFLFLIAFGLLDHLGFNLTKFWAMFSDGFNFKSGESTSERTLQFFSLIHGWFDSSILFGAGNGSTVDVVRSTKIAWAYELTYVYLLFSTGLVGFLFYFFWFGYGLLRIRQSLKKRPDLKVYVLPMMTGVFSLTTAAATNPYFGKFDYLWIIMLPHLLAGGLKFQRVAI